MFKYSKILISALLVMVVVLAFGSGFFYGQAGGPISTAGLDIINEAWNYLSSQYVEPAALDTANMTRAAIEGMIETIQDPYTAYLTKNELEQFVTSLQGEYAGIGAIVSLQDEKIVIVATFKDAPAEKAGLKSGDAILEINGESLAGLSLDMAVSKIRGPAGTAVKLLILRAGESQPVEIEVTRAMVEIPSVTYELRGDIAVIAIIQFTERTDTELAAFIKQVKADQAQGIVLDLRGNGGGWLDIVIRVASRFISEGIIVKVRSNEGIIETHEAVDGLETIALPMVVLVDEFSASGAEVLAGALQDHQRALIAGNVTYGKGSVNSPVQLSDGSGLYITIARWLTPNDRLIEGQGIEPDIKLDITGEEELQWAIDYLSDNLSQ